MASIRIFGFLRKAGSASRSDFKPSRLPEGGFVLLFCTFLIVVLFAITALVFDFGRALVERHRISIAADAASIAALNVLGPGTSYNAVLSEVNSIVQFNNVSPGEILSVRCGTWSGGNFTPQAAGVCNGTSNSVQVESRRVVPTFFARLIGVADLSPRVSALAHVPMQAGNNCIRPFGITTSYFISINSPNGPHINQEFEVGGSQSGNWGKLDIGGISDSNNPNKLFESGMLSDLCDQEVQLNSQVDTFTGNSSIQNVFDVILADNTEPFAYSGMILPLTSDFPNGHSAQVTIHEFIKVDLIWHNRRNGNQWRAKFRLIERNVAPPQQGGGGIGGTRHLVQ